MPCWRGLCQMARCARTCNAREQFVNLAQGVGVLHGTIRQARRRKGRVTAGEQDMGGGASAGAGAACDGAKGR